MQAELNLPQVGDRGPGFAAPDHTGASASPLADEVAGRPIVLIFGRESPAIAAVLKRYAELKDAFASADALIFPVLGCGVEAARELRERAKLPFAVHADPLGDVARLYVGAEKSGSAITSVVMDPNFRVLQIVDDTSNRPHADIVLDLVRQERALRPAAPLGMHAPVLVLPRVLGREQCRELIDMWHRPVRTWHTDGLTSAGYNDDKADFKVRNDSYGKVVQYVLRDPAVSAKLDANFARKVADEMQRAFQTRVTQREVYRIACYDAEESGSLPAHRDNVSKMAEHRRFTISINLNAEEFEGGELRFPEYGSQLYKTETGMAVIWSCTLLHEVMPVTSGRRFILGTHLFGN
ncbi:MAG TPA: 2OG-Fe(II) oxygenase [Candidatus Cybelea sp.]|nr:2OG-Fe(II) oxygenase [Candidatus Cybelea sp.]